MYRVLNQKFFCSLFLVAILITCAHTASATTVIMPTDANMIIGSRAIIRGRVLNVESALDPQSNRIFTYITMRVQEVFKGQINERKIILKQEGGQIEGRGSIVFGTPQFTLDQEALLYLDTWADGSFRLHQYFLGKFDIVTDSASGQQFAIRSEMTEGVVVLQNHSQLASGEDITNRMELSAYRQMLRNKIAANAEQSLLFEQRYYSNTPMNARPAEYAELIGKGRLQPQWTYISSNHPRWFEPDSGQPVVFRVNPDGAPNAQINNDIVAAMNAWSTIPGCAMRLTVGSNTTACFPDSANNTIIFNNCDGRWSAGGGSCQGILALGGLGWNGNSRVINGVSFVQANQGFVSFNPFAACNFSNSCNVREITTHELGHALGLGHSADTSATMYGIAHFDGRCASVRPDDTAAMVFIYPGQGGGSGPLSIVTNSPLPNANIGSLYSQSIVATGGTTPYTWSIVSGALPLGLLLNAQTGSISGTPTTTGTANFTLQVRDTAQATAQKPFSITVSAASNPLDSQFVSWTAPTTVQPGQQFEVNVKFNNTGTIPWVSGLASDYYLASQNPALNVTWGGNGVTLANFPTQPGQQLDLNFLATAPATPGAYNFQWQLYQNGGVGFFGQTTPNVVIQVGSGGAAPLSVTTTSLANGTVGTAYSQALAATGGTTPYTWSVLSGALPAGLTLNASTGAISGTPTASGTSSFTVQARDAAQTTATRQLSLLVNPSTAPVNNATFVSQSVSASMTAGQPSTVSLVMTNTGTTTWAAGTYKLGSQNPQDNMTWGVNRVNLATAVAPNASATFNFTVTAPTAAGTYNFQWKMFDGAAFFGATSTNVSVTVSGGGCTVPVAAAPSSLPGDTVWLDDQLPSGSVAEGTWTWDTTQKASGTRSNTEPSQPGIHQHYFYNASPLTVGQSDKLVCYVLLNPCDTPQEIMLQWFDAVNGWEHRAYWGANTIPWGNSGTTSRAFMGGLPTAGQWVRLEIPATSVGLNGRVVTGMAFSLSNGQAWFDRAGKDNVTGGGGCTVPVAAAPSSLPGDTVWLDDQLPSGSVAEGIWMWDAAQKASGTQSHTEPSQPGIHQHYFGTSQTLFLATNDKLVCYVLLSTCDTPQEIMLQWHDASGWEHRAYWGADVIPWGNNGTTSRAFMGALPAAGQWVRLEIPASLVGLSGRTIDGMAFSLSNGQAWFDRAGKSSQ
jgi:hypothetical protein